LGARFFYTKTEAIISESVAVVDDLECRCAIFLISKEETMFMSKKEEAVFLKGGMK